MAILLDAQQLTASFGARPLFEGVSFTVDEKERIGLIGPNGAGKSTLLRILAETASADQRHDRAAARPARRAPGADAAVRGRRHGARRHPGGDRRRARRPRRARAGAPGVRDAGARRRGGGPGPDTPIASLSGGWKKRVAIGRDLARQPDLLLLDEPTNHLDVEGIEWLEALLSRRGAAFATITVTHDRLFLQRVTTRILELDRRNAGGLLSVAGDYATYVRVKAETMHAQERREVVLRNTLRRETEWLRRGAAARSTKQQARIARAGTLGDEVAELGRRNQTRTATLDFGAAEARPTPPDRGARRSRRATTGARSSRGSTCASARACASACSAPTAAASRR